MWCRPARHCHSPRVTDITVVAMCLYACIVVWLSREAFLLWSSVQWSRDGGILVIVRVSANLYVHGSMGRVNGCVGLAIKSPKCVMRNVDAHTERKRERGRARERPSYLLHSLTDVCLLISLPCINTPVKAQPGGKLISYYLIIILGFAWSVC